MAANRLVDAASAYLQSASHQPIHWYPWGPDAFAAARAADRPILLDIGAVWCHWCHVMDGESYEDPALAEFLNANFVAIKVDRDERPDVDARYQRAVQTLIQQGGWPLTAFLTPDGEVFYGGTYFPPDGRHGRPGFRTVLESVLDAYRNRPEQVTAQAAAIRKALEQQLDESRPGEPSVALLEGAVNQMSKVFDTIHGGFGTQPKFPHPAAMLLLLDRWHDTRAEPVARMLHRTLEGMGRGGVYDQIGGGFHRYSVDAQWIVPHFEKMSYDNSELLRAYVEAFAAFDLAEYAGVARGIVRWLREVLADLEGGYGASQDADVGLDDDGDYFTWTREEAAGVLTADELEVAAGRFDIGTAGEMHHDPSRNVLFIAATVPALAIRLRKDEGEVRALLESAVAKLRGAREARPAPFVDRTRYAAWNAMLVGALLRAGAVLEDRWAMEHALLSLSRLRGEQSEPDAVAHTPGGIGGLLDDQVQTALAGLDAYEATGERRWLEWAEAILARVWRDYRDDSAGGLFDTARERKGEGLLPARAKPVQDAPTPSGNGAAALAAVRLAELTDSAAWRERAVGLVRTFAGAAHALGFYAATLLRAADWVLQPPTHFVITGPTGNAEADTMHRAALATYVPRRVVHRLTPDSVAPLPGPVAEMVKVAGSSTAPRGYACTGLTCRVPAEGSRAWSTLLAGLR